MSIDRNIITDIISCIAFVQKNFKHSITGADKKKLVLDKIRVMALQYDDYENINLFIQEYGEDLIDALCFIVKNKKIINLFKKPCFKICF